MEVQSRDVADGLKKRPAFLKMITLDIKSRKEPDQIGINCWESAVVSHLALN